MRLVMKFGGASIADGEKIKWVAELINRHRDHELVVVTSALKNVTDHLLEQADMVTDAGDIEAVRELIAHLRDVHYRAAHVAINDEIALNQVLGELDSRIRELAQALTGICYLGELTPRSSDYISSYGELLSAPILSGALRSIGISSTHLTGREAGIITNSEYGAAKPLEGTNERIRESLLPLIRECVPVVTGFIAEDASGIPTTLGRGGSDFSASLIGDAIDADEIWFWKEVSGIMTADPEIVPDARNIPLISYIEVMELSYFGAKVLHPRAIEPAIRNDLPVRVLNTFDPDFTGTLVVKEQEQGKEVVKAVTVIENIALINVSGAGMVGTIGVAARVFGALADAGVNITMISQGSSEANISIVVEESHLNIAADAIRSEFKNGVIRELTMNPDVSAVAVVGAGMVGTPGIAARVFTAMGSAGINVIMISQGSSEHNISFVVQSDDAERAVRALHSEFGLGLPRS